MHDELQALRTLVKRRQDWLSKPDNRLRRTYQAVAEDTRQLERLLEEKKNEQNKNKEL